MARINRKRGSSPSRERHGVPGELERLIVFVAGVVAGALVTRARTPRQTTQKVVLTAEPTLPLAPAPSAFPQAQHWSEVPAHERSDANLLAFGAVLVLLLVFAFLIHASLWQLANSRGPAGIDAATRWKPIEHESANANSPQLQLSPQRDLQQFLAAQQQQLHHGQESDRSNASAHIPIERAMTSIVEHGTPKWSTSSPKAVSPLELQHQRATEGGKPK